MAWTERKAEKKHKIRRVTIPNDRVKLDFAQDLHTNCKGKMSLQWAFGHLVTDCITPEVYVCVCFGAGVCVSNCVWVIYLSDQASIKDCVALCVMLHPTSLREYSFKNLQETQTLGFYFTSHNSSGCLLSDDIYCLDIDTVYYSNSGQPI